MYTLFKKVPTPWGIWLDLVGGIYTIPKELDPFLDYLRKEYLEHSSQEWSYRFAVRDFFMIYYRELHHNFFKKNPELSVSLSHPLLFFAILKKLREEEAAEQFQPPLKKVSQVSGT